MRRWVPAVSYVRLEVLLRPVAYPNGAACPTGSPASLTAALR